MKKMITSPQVHFFVLETIKQRNELSSLNKANTSFKRKNEILFYPPFFNRLKRKGFINPFTILSKTICKDKSLFFPCRVITSLYTLNHIINERLDHAYVKRKHRLVMPF